MIEYGEFNLTENMLKPCQFKIRFKRDHISVKYVADSNSGSFSGYMEKEFNLLPYEGYIFGPGIPNETISNDYLYLNCEEETAVKLWAKFGKDRI